MTAPATSQKRFGPEFWLWVVLMLVSLPPLLLTAVIASRAVVAPSFSDLPKCYPASGMEFLGSLLPSCLLLLVVGGIAFAAHRQRLNWLKPVVAACSCVAVAQLVFSLLVVWRTPAEEECFQSASAAVVGQLSAAAGATLIGAAPA